MRACLGLGEDNQKEKGSVIHLVQIWLLKSRWISCTSQLYKIVQTANCFSSFWHSQIFLCNHFFIILFVFALVRFFFFLQFFFQFLEFFSNFGIRNNIYICYMLHAIVVNICIIYLFGAFSSTKWGINNVSLPCNLSNCPNPKQIK